MTNYFHGSYHKKDDIIKKFDTKYFYNPDGVAALGHGFYFTKEQNIAVGYSEPKSTLNYSNENQSFLYRVNLNIDKTLNLDYECKIKKSLFIKLLKTSPKFIDCAQNFGEIKNFNKKLENILYNPDEYFNKYKSGEIGMIDIIKNNNFIINANPDVLSEILYNYEDFLEEKNKFMDFINIIGNDFYPGDTETLYKNIKDFTGYDSVYDIESGYISCWFSDKIDIKEVFEISFEDKGYELKSVIKNDPEFKSKSKDLDLDI